MEDAAICVCWGWLLVLFSVEHMAGPGPCRVLGCARWRSGQVGDSLTVTAYRLGRAPHAVSWLEVKAMVLEMRGCQGKAGNEER